MAVDTVVKHVVLDAGAFLRNAPVQNIGEKIYTLPEVVEEIKDKATKQRLQVLPYQLIYREPPTEAIKTVTEFAKKTGDYGSLSAVDIRVMALTLQLEQENVGTGHIKTVPENKVVWNCRRNLEKATDIAGFYIKQKKSSSRTTSECSTSSETDSQITEHITERLEPVKEDHHIDTVRPEVPHKTLDSSEESRTKETLDLDATEETSGETDTDKVSHSEPDSVINENHDKQSNHSTKSQELQEGEIITDDCLQEGSDESEDNESDDNDEDDDDDDDDGWITPSNIKNVKEKMGMGDTEKASVPVGCITTDFAMQNVLIQMGLNVISVDGLLIKRAKSFVLRCHACMRITTNVQKEFCPHCGNKTLKRVSMTVNEDGSITYFLSNRPISLRGTNVSLPRPRGGKHANNPHLVEDQPYPQQRPSKKSLNKVDVFNPDYIASQSPFLLNDVTSRAAQLGIRSKKGQNSWDRRNHNLGRKKRK